VQEGGPRRRRQNSLLTAAQPPQTWQRPLIQGDHHRDHILPPDLARQTERHRLKMELHQRKDARYVNRENKLRNTALKAPFNQRRSERAGNGSRRAPAPWMGRIDAMVRQLPDMGANRRLVDTQFR
jgi:hypothetical protein